MLLNPIVIVTIRFNIILRWIHIDVPSTTLWSTKLKFSVFGLKAKNQIFRAQRSIIYQY